MHYPIFIATVVLGTLLGCTKPIQKPTRITQESPIPPHAIEPLPATMPGQRPDISHPEPPSPILVSPASRSAIVESASRLVGARTITSQGRHIAYDCAGVTRAIFLEHGIDLYRGYLGDRKENGVRLIHNHVRQHGILHQDPDVHPGDLVFFDNTWDFNGDGQLNDPLTHVGIVEQRETDGTVVFISRIAKSIARYRMNLSQPHVHKTADGRVLNDYIRRKRPTDPADTARLTGELFSFYGNLLSPQPNPSSDNQQSISTSSSPAGLAR